MSSARVRLEVRGAVQGVGFRPWVYRQALELGLRGWVRNEGGGVVIEAEGDRALELVARVRDNPPRHARVDSVRDQQLAPVGDSDFRIAESREDASSPRVVPDIVTCDDCLRELFDPASRHYRYPFTNCSQCGPRYSIIERVPYDRAHTTMRAFTMCADCRREYDAPADRRFHAQPTACARCGPKLEADGEPVSAAAEALRAGKVVALKGMGGFQLLVDARQETAIRILRERKQRPHKPFAVMARDVAQAREFCEVSDAEELLLRSPAGPIVLLARKQAALPACIAPGLDTLGVLLPTTPLHHLLMRELDGPVVCTSGNLSDEPICIDNAEARERLGAIADLFLIHNRPIRRAMDDSVARVIDGAPQVLRLARGYAPLSLPLESAAPVLATGAHLKCTVAVATGSHAVVSQHVGDLENTLSIDAMRAASADLCDFHALKPAAAACDLHPDYASTHHARQLGVPVHQVQHHLAHALACMLEHNLRGPLLAVVWDGTGLGRDGSIWGGEFLRVERTTTGIAWARVGHLKAFPLPGGDAAARDARRALAGLMWETPDLRDHVPETLKPQLDRNVNAPLCTSAGRLFDGVAALLGLCDEQTYEAQAPALLEAAADSNCDAYPMPFEDGVMDWRPALMQAARDRDSGVPAGVIAGRFHAALAGGIAAAAHALGESTVVLTGGCFHNRVLTEAALGRLRAAGITPWIARQLPPNDGGIAAGQLVAAAEGIANVSGRSRQD